MSDNVRRLIIAMFRDSVQYHLFEKAHDGGPLELVQLYQEFRSMLNDDAKKLFDEEVSRI